ncbi:MAG: FliH/SctL family protein [Alphaproteobacteria bacterium]|nr:FliH/SctL family protein [Alphaproteobacteria bacterium]
MYTDPQTAKKAADDLPARKFMFDRSFDSHAPKVVAERKPVLMKPEQIDALKKEGHDAGFEAGRQAGLDAQAAETAKILASIDNNVTALMQKLAELNDEQNKQTRLLALAIAKKILPEFAAKAGMQEMEAVIEGAIRDMAREPRLVVRTHESQLDAINERVQAIAAQRAFSGKIIVLADAEVASGDCRVEWADGGVERNQRATLAAVEQTVNPTV